MHVVIISRTLTFIELRVIDVSNIEISELHPVAVQNFILKVSIFLLLLSFLIFFSLSGSQPVSAFSPTLCSFVGLDDLCISGYLHFLIKWPDQEAHFAIKSLHSDC